MRNEIRMAFIAAIAMYSCLAQTGLDTNIYAQVRAVYGDETLSSDSRRFCAIRGEGFNAGWMNDGFKTLCRTVSNNCSQIASDWHIYGTNEVVNYTVLSAVCFSGWNVYTNFTEQMLAHFETDTNSCQWATIDFLVAPPGTPQERSLAMNYDLPAVSNILVRMRALAISIDDVPSKASIEYRLSGDAKQDFLDMKAAGAW